MMFSHISRLLLIVSILLECSHQTAVGPEGEGNGSETTARGIIVDSTGTPVPAIPIQILPASYNPVLKDTHSVDWHTTTDAKGEYNLKGISAGTYNIKAGFTSAGAKALIKNVYLTGKKNEVIIDTARLQKTASAVIDLSEITFHAGDYLYIPGTDVFTIITAENSSTGKANLNYIPAGTFTDINFIAATGPQITNLLKDTLEMQPGDTFEFAYTTWVHSAKLVLNTASSGADIRENVCNFPVLVRLNEKVFDFSLAKDDGRDIRFAKSNGVPLVYEIERWDPTINKAEVWVKCDTVHGNDSTQFITMYWGNSRAIDVSDGTKVFDTAAGFTGVWHLNEDPSDGPGAIKDRSVNAFHATSSGLMTSSNSIEGTIGKALTFNGKDDYLNAGNVAVFDHYSIGLWVYLNTVDFTQRFIFKDSSYTLWYDRIQASIRMEHMDSVAMWSGLLQNGGVGVPMTTGAWCYLTGTFDGTKTKIYQNGNEVTSSNEITAHPLVSQNPLLFGKSWKVDFVDGSMDEIRVERTARSADWVKLCYMNQRIDDKLIKFK